ncbi:hypothetical protein FACS1894201_03750 [Bacteroidia bacterium]|nr:hypothetical protein FACS1894201_03750 [Bacteroidia bacterium]
MKKIVCLCSLLSLVYICNAVSYIVQPVTKLSQSKSVGEGLYYALPQQVLRFRIIVKRTDYIKGLYMDYARPLLGANNVIHRDSVSYSIANIEMITESRIDPSQIYYIQPKGDAISITYAETKFPLIQSITVGMPEDPKKRSNQAEPAIDVMTDNPVSDFSTIPYTNIRNAFNGSLIMNNTTMFTAATDLVSRLVKVREERQRLLGSFYEIAYSAETFDLLKKSFDETEHDIMALFSGYTNTTYETYYLEYLPQKRTIATPQRGSIKRLADTVFAAFSEVKGYSTVNMDEDTPVLRLQILPEESLDKAFITSTVEQKGFVYCIPSYATVQLMLSGGVVFSERVQLSQLGVVRTLPTMFGRFVFSPHYGTLIKVDK